MRRKSQKNFLDIVDHLQALPVAYSEVIKVLCIAAILPVTTASNECLFSSLETVKNYLRSTTGDDRPHSPPLNWTTTSLLTILQR